MPAACSAWAAFSTVASSIRSAALVPVIWIEGSSGYRLGAEYTRPRARTAMISRYFHRGYLLSMTPPAPRAGRVDAPLDLFSGSPDGRPRTGRKQMRNACLSRRRHPGGSDGLQRALGQGSDD